MSDQELYERAMERMKKAGVSSSSLSSRIDNVIFLEKEIEDYRRKLDYAESRIHALCAQQMQTIQLEQKLNKEWEELHKPAMVEPMPTFELLPKTAAGEIIKALADNGFDTITINTFKSKEGNSDD